MTEQSPPGRLAPGVMVTGGYVTLEVPGSTPMRAYVARPAHEGPHPGMHPGMLVFQEAFGVNEHIRDIATRFAAQGFVAIAPELYHRIGLGVEGQYDDFAGVMPYLQSLTNEGLAADVHAADDWLSREPGVDASRIAAVGYCMGGRVAFLANSEVPLTAAISYYGGGIAPSLLDRVAALRAPQLMFWGGTDTHIPPQQHRAIDDALRAAGKAYTTVEFGEAGHAFFSDPRSSYHADAAAESWALVLAFLARTTGITPVL